MKVAIYTRVSTAEQNPEMQKQQIVDYCKNRGYTIYEIYEDASSGKKDSRPAFDKLLFSVSDAFLLLDYPPAPGNEIRKGLLLLGRGL